MGESGKRNQMKLSKSINRVTKRVTKGASRPWKKRNSYQKKADSRPFFSDQPPEFLIHIESTHIHAQIN
jgi:hypothetical protein